MGAKQKFIGLLLVVLVLAACAVQHTPEGGFLSVSNAPAPALAPLVRSEFQNVPDDAAPNEVAQDIQLNDGDIARVILKNASLTLTVEEPATRIQEIASLAEAFGGWVVSSNTYTGLNSAGEETASGTITIRVQSERLDEALARIKDGALKVDNENITGQDVTQEYVDTASRLSNLQATERQLQTIMDSANTVEDVLAVQRELTNVRSEIEVLQGRISYFDEAAAFSSITVDVRPRALDPVAAQSLGWSPATTAENAVGALVGLLQMLVDLAIVVLIIGLPLGLIIGMPIWLVWRSRSRIVPRPSKVNKAGDQSA